MLRWPLQFVFCAFLLAKPLVAQDCSQLLTVRAKQVLVGPGFSEGHFDSDLRFAAVSPDVSHVTVFGKERGYLWDVAGAKPQVEFDVHPQFEDVRVDSSASRMTAVGSNGRLYFFDMNSGALKESFRFLPGDDVALEPNSDGSLWVYTRENNDRIDVGYLDPLTKNAVPLRNHRAAKVLRGFSPSSEWVLTKSNFQNSSLVRVERIDSGLLLFNAICAPRACELPEVSPNHERLAIPLVDGSVHVYSLKGEAQLVLPKTMPSSDELYPIPRFDPGSRRIAVVRPDGVWVYDLLAEGPSRLIARIKAHMDSPFKAEWTPKGNLLINYSDGTLIAFDGNNFNPLYQLRGHRLPINSFDFSPETLVTTDDESVRLWDLSELPTESQISRVKVVEKGFSIATDSGPHYTSVVAQ